MRRLVVATLLMVGACTRTSSTPSMPVSPSPAPVALADFSGYWGGTFSYKGCAGLHCVPVERTDPFSLRLRQTANHVTGVFASAGGDIEISGDVQPDGSLRLTGSEATGGTRGVPGDATFSAPALRLDPALGLGGTMRFERHTFLSGERFTYLSDGTIVSAAQRNLDAYIADLSGTWKGLYLVRRCVDETGRALCGLFRPDEVEYLQLTLTIAGDSASGELVPVSTHIPVDGRVRGRTLELEGMRDETSGRLIDRVTTFSGTVDEFGRLNGRFTYLRTFNGITSTAEVDLLQVVKVP
jgi:hypothetical protein